MSSTNHTTNYNLPQFVGSDKPAWLGDINPAFSAIDTAMHTNATNASQGIADAATAKSTADGAELHAQQGISDAATAQRTANDASAEATRAGQIVDALVEKLTLDDFTSCDIASTGSHGNIKLTLAQSEDGSIFKVYGYFNLPNTASTTANGVFTISNFTVDGNTISCVDTGLILKSAPSAGYIIAPAGTVFIRDDSNTSAYKLTNDSQVFIYVHTNGHIFVGGGTLSSGSISAKTTMKHYFYPSLYFNSNFGDMPQPE
jgi:hypothetical protein